MNTSPANRSDMWRNLPVNLASWLLERGTANKPALVDSQTTLTYGQLRALVAQQASVVMAQVDSNRSEVVPIIGESGLAVAITYLGVLCAGAIPALISPFTNDQQLQYVFARTNARLAFIDRARQTPAGEGLTVLPLATGTQSPLPAEEYAPLRAQQSPALMLFTSGSTAMPRGVVLSSRNVIASSEAIIKSTGLQSSDRSLAVLPLYYCYGLSVMHTTLRCGGTLYFSSSLPEDLLDVAEQENITNIAGVPSIFYMLVHRSTLSARQIPALRFMMVSGGKLEQATIDALQRVIPGCELFIRYGITEVTAAASIVSAATAKPGSIGKGLPGLPLFVVRSDGQAVGPGEIGEIVVRGPHVGLGYLDESDATQSAFGPSGFHSGDLAHMDDEGNVYIVGRRKSFIKVGGHRISPEEIEEAIAQVPSVVVAGVCGRPDPVRGEALVAAVVVHDRASWNVDETKAHCRDTLPAFKVPSSFIPTPNLPTLPNGKLDRKALARLVDATRDET